MALIHYLIAILII